MPRVVTTAERARRKKWHRGCRRAAPGVRRSRPAPRVPRAPAGL